MIIIEISRIVEEPIFAQIDTLRSDILSLAIVVSTEFVVTISVKVEALWIVVISSLEHIEPIIITLSCFLEISFFYFFFCIFLWSLQFVIQDSIRQV